MTIARVRRGLPAGSLIVALLIILSFHPQPASAVRSHCTFQCLDTLRSLPLFDSARYQFVLVADGLHPTDTSMAQALVDEQGILSNVPLAAQRQGYPPFVLNLHGQRILNDLNAGDADDALRELRRANDGL